MVCKGLEKNNQSPLHVHGINNEKKASPVLSSSGPDCQSEAVLEGSFAFARRVVDCALSSPSLCLSLSLGAG